ncbi:MAG: hypothetical protein VKL42_12025 [Snowella sp.]|nr:hypothetical protein [Snowella sp.]
MARKSKEFRQLFYQDSVQPARLSRIKTKSQKESEAFKRFKATLESQPENEGTIFVTNPQGFEKISEQLMRFIHPYLPVTESYEDRLRLFDMAVLAWNLAILPSAQREEFLTSYLAEQVNPLDREALEMFADFRELLTELIQRKLKLFGKEKRFIQDFQLIEDDEEIRVMVSFSLPN